MRIAEDDETVIQTVVEGELYIDPEWALPLDFSMAPQPNPEGFTENGYEDQSIRVSVETREMFGSPVHIAFIRIADPSQLRTAVFDKVDKFETVARSVNAVVVMNGDQYTELPDKKTFEIRMTQVIRSQTNNMKDILVIDDLGNFHLFIRSQGLHKGDNPYYIQQIKDEGRRIVNALTFGPALVKDGELIDQTQNEKEYSYAPNYKNPRSAIGQTGPLSYVMVVVEGRGDEPGVTIRELAQIMYDLGCIQAYALDGGNTANMILFGPPDESGSKTNRFFFKGDQTGGERGIKDIIYFATAVPESEW